MAMKLLLHQAALRRVEKGLAATGVPLELYVADAEGTVRHGGAVVAREALAPDIIWFSIDTFGPQMRLYADVAKSAPAVKWIQTFNAGLDHPVYRQIFDRGIKMSNSNAQAVAIAEYVLAQVLADWHPIAQQRAAQAKHEWQRIGFRELSQSSWLIIGYGNIGREIARRAKGFGAQVVGIRRSGGSDEFADAMRPQSALPDLLPAADIVALTCPLNEETRDLANAGFFAAMKQGSFLVNIGRGGLVDETALLKALDADRPRLAILDVFREEPLPKTSPFWDHPKLRLTAHTSASGSGTLGRGDQLFLDNLVRFTKGEPLINTVTERSF